MKVIKPNKLSTLTRCFEHERQFMFGISVLVFVPLAPQVELLSEQALWTFAAERMGPQVAIEAGVPKARGEFLIHGECFAPGGVPHPRVPVSARVGERERALMVTGDRYWKPGGSASEPQPFERMPLDWTRAYGGPRYKRNPLGRGHGESDYMGQRVQLLPNIEDPKALVLSPRDKVEPVSFGAMDISWPQRRELAGTYDKRWLETLSPGMAADIDWRLFNLAQPAQHIDGFWKGGESYRLDNMHPERPVLEGELPRLTARAFVGRHAGGDPEADVGLEPVELSLRTLWMFPDAERAVLIYQGSTQVAEDDGRDVEYLMIAAEHADRPRSAEHYAGVLESRLDEEYGTLAALKEHELLPEGLADSVDPGQAAEQALHHKQRTLEHNLHRRALREHERAEATLREHGIDPDEFGLKAPEPPPKEVPPDQIPAMVERLQADADARREKEEADFKERREQLDAKLEAMGVSDEERARLLDEDKPGPTGPPTFTAQGERERMNALLEQARATGAPTEQLEQLLMDPEQHERWEQAEAKLRETYRKTAHLQDPAPRMSAERSEEAREVLRQLVGRGEGIGDQNLTGADLSGMDLSGADLRDALFEGACLDGADLRRAKLGGAVLAHASICKARLDGADLSGANLGGSVMHEASLAEADLGGAELSSADLEGASLRGATLSEATLRQTKLKDVDARQIETQKLTLIEVEAKGLRLSGAELPEAVFVRIDLSGGDLSRARLTGATFVGCEAAKVSFAGADLGGARFVEGCTMDEGSFVGAQLSSCNLRGSSMKACDLSQARMDGADLSECTLSGAKLYRAVARGTRFEKADLEDAFLVGANLMGASFLNAVIRGADLRDTNLYGADMARVRTDERVRLGDANLEKVRIHPRHEEAEA